MASTLIRGLGAAVTGLGVAATATGLVFVYKAYFTSALYDGKERLVGKVAVVTGAGSGIGYELASKLAGRGASVYMVTRNFAECEEKRRKIAFRTHNRRVYCRECDLSCLKSVRQLAAELTKQEEKIDLLVNNACVKYPVQREITGDGIEAQFAVNFLSHYLLTEQLLSSLLRSPEARVLFVTCLPAHPDLSKAFDFTDLNWDESYEPETAYRRSKEAALLYMAELQQRLATDNAAVTVVAADPGLSFTGIDRHMPYSKNFVSRLIFSFINTFALRSALQGAQTPLFCLASSDPVALAGKCFKDMQTVCEPVAEVRSEDAQRMTLIAKKWTESKVA